MSKFGTLDHRAQVTLLLFPITFSSSFQVILYCLMLSDRHQTAVPNGLLYYMKTGHTQTVSAPRNETIGRCGSSDCVLFISLRRSRTDQEQASTLSWKLLGSREPSKNLAQPPHVPEVSTC